MEHITIIDNLNILAEFVPLNFSYFFDDENLHNTSGKFITLNSITQLNVLDLNNINNNEENFKKITSSFFENYLYFHIDSNSFILIGPFLDNKIGNNTIKTFSKKNNFSSYIENKIISYYKELKILNNTQLQNYINLTKKVFITDNKIKEVSYDQKIDWLTDSEDYNDSILFYSNNYKIRSPIALEIKLLHYIENSDELGALEIINKINSLDHASLSSSDLQSRKYSLVALCTLYTRILIKLNINYVKAFSFSDLLINKIDLLTTYNEAVNFEKKMTVEFCRFAKKESTLKYSINVSNILNYIYQNLTKKISLEDISNVVNLNTSHVCRIFKNEIGMTVYEFIMKKRLEECVYLLEHSNNNIIDISSLYCFCSESHFISTFKKHFNVTPKQFRKSKNTL